MKEFFEPMTGMEQAYWIVALVGTVLLLVIFLLTFIGGDVDGDFSADTTEFDLDDNGIGFQFFTFKSVVAFFTVFGWTGVFLLDNGVSTYSSVITSTIAGLVMMILVSLLFFWMHKLSSSGTLNIKKSIGVIGEVYLPIGSNRSKMGKVQLKVQGSFRELEALTDSEEELKTGTTIRVTGVISSEILLVEKLTN